MSIYTQIVLGFSCLLVGWMVDRWASTHDVKGWIVDALWRAIFRQDWKLLQTTGARDLLDKDPTLKRQIEDKVSVIKSDAHRYGMTRSLAKQGALLATAYAAKWLSALMLIVGFIALAHSAYRWLS